MPRSDGGEATDYPRMSLSSYLAARASLASGTSFLVALEAVASTALAHPEWPPLQEKRTWEEWEEWERD